MVLYLYILSFHTNKNHNTFFINFDLPIYHLCWLFTMDFALEIKMLISITFWFWMSIYISRISWTSWLNLDIRWSLKISGAHCFKIQLVWFPNSIKMEDQCCWWWRSWGLVEAVGDEDDGTLHCLTWLKDKSWWKMWTVTWNDSQKPYSTFSSVGS